jgi:hypothetical protein
MGPCCARRQRCTAFHGIMHAPRSSMRMFLRGRDPSCWTLSAGSGRGRVVFGHSATRFGIRAQRTSSLNSSASLSASARVKAGSALWRTESRSAGRARLSVFQRSSLSFVTPPTQRWEREKASFNREHLWPRLMLDRGRARGASEGFFAGHDCHCPIHVGKPPSKRLGVAPLFCCIAAGA